MSTGYSVEAILRAVDKGFSATLSAAEKQLNSVTASAQSGSAKLGAISNSMISVGSNMTKYLTTPIATGVVAAVKGFAGLEQSLGGVETMFKSSASTVINNAKQAYVTAGVSANDYMEQVTSFSASLLQGLGGDTVAAARYADMAVKDMSDNANKFGTDIGRLQDAYQGFAKGNYTMLDNLKLGYGGTKGEMERLITHANELKVANGELADLSIENFADIVEAINLVQQEMGVFDTTAEEAKKTVSGSFGMMKAAGKNFLDGLGETSFNSQEQFKQMTDAAKVFGGNIAKTLGNIWKAIPLTDLQKNVIATVASLGPLAIGFGQVGSVMASVWGATGKLAAGLGAIPNKVSSIKSQFMDFGSNLRDAMAPAELVFDKVKSKMSGLGEVFAPEIGKVKSLFGGLGEKMTTPFKQLTERFPGVSSGLKTLGGAFGQSFTGMGNILQTFSGLAMKSLMPAAIFGAFLAGLGLLQGQFGDQINQMVQVAVTQGPTIITNLVNGIASRIPDLISQGTQLIQQFTQVIVANAPAVFQGAVALITALVQGVGNNASQLIGSAVQIIGVLVNGLLTSLPQLLTVGMQFLVQLAQGVVQNIPLILTTAQTIFTNFINAIVTNLPTIIQSGIQIIVTLAQGIIQNLPQIIQTAMTIIQSLIGGLAQAAPQIALAGIELVVQLAASLINNTDKLVYAGWELIKGFFMAMIEGVVTFGESVVSGITGLWDRITGKSKEGAEQAKVSIDDFATSTSSRLAQMPPEADMHLSLFSDTIKSHTEAAKSAGVGSAEELSKGVTTATSQMSSGAIEDSLSLFKGVTSNLQSAHATAATEASQMAGDVVNKANQMASQGTSEVQKLNNGYTQQMAQAKIKALAEADAMERGVVQKAQSKASGVDKSLNQINTSVSTGWAKASSSSQAGADKVATATQQGFDKAKTSATKSMTGIEQATVKGMTSINKAVTDGANKFQQTFTQSFDKVKALVESSMTAIQSKYQAGMTQLVNLSQSTGQQLVGIFNALQGPMSQAGSYAGAGFASGLASQAGHIMSIAQSIAASVSATIRAALAIHSPSRVMKKLGGYTGEGLALGIEGWVPKVSEVADDLAQAAVPNLASLDVRAGFNRVKDALSGQLDVSLSTGQECVQPLHLEFSLAGQEFEAFVDDITALQGKKEKIRLRSSSW